MQRGSIPSIAALLAFESAGRHLSFSRAAAELHLTQGAISRQIRQLEDALGVPLFERVNQRVILTDAGRSYLRDITPLMEGLAVATRKVMSGVGAEATLNLAVLPTFATRWLMPRLPAFLSAHPEVTVNFTVRLAPFDFAEDTQDAAIHHGEATWPGAVCEHLCREAVVPVAAPDIRARYSVAAPADLAALPLLHQSTRPDAWRDWFAMAGVETAAAYRGARFDQFAMIAEAAAAGLGVALVPRFLVESELQSGRLEILFDRAFDAGTSYWFVYPEAMAGGHWVRTFGDWLKRMAAGEA
ncbi:transcriptional regulator GcvA [Mongoliimonas terrestris]|uniref:transcriptional regulator GcvA n=1 Tax=Mongoliimonas terrestris TaxID=1709001 RepID=UPI000949A195|nr:transcriptional regulator GcvA [Mongoliimonas terrestris]